MTSLNSFAKGSVLENAHGEKIQIHDIQAWDKVYYFYVGYQDILVGQKSNLIRCLFKSPYRKLSHGGHFGVGPYKESQKSYGVLVYSVWSHMMKRCYSQSDPSYALYGAKGVSVCEEWHCYQLFADWYVKNIPKSDGCLQLDKDLLSGVVKIYSPETCCFLTAKENSLVSNAKYYKVSVNGGDYKYVHSLRAFAIENGIQQSYLCNVALGKVARSKKYKVIEISKLEFENEMA